MKDSIVEADPNRINKSGNFNNGSVVTASGVA